MTDPTENDGPQMLVVGDTGSDDPIHDVFVIGPFPTVLDAMVAARAYPTEVRCVIPLTAPDDPTPTADQPSVLLTVDDPSN